MITSKHYSHLLGATEIAIGHGQSTSHIIETARHVVFPIGLVQNRSTSWVVVTRLKVVLVTAAALYRSSTAWEWRTIN